MDTASPRIDRRTLSCELRASFEHRHGQTILSDLYHTAPLKIAKTFRLPDEDNALYVHMMDASPGILNGDHYQIHCRLGENSHVYLTNQSYTKIHPTPEGESRLEQTFHLAKGAVLEYFPEPTVPYRLSRFRSETNIRLARGAVAFVGEVLAPGRLHHGERFAYTSFSAKTEAYVDDMLTNWDHFHLEPAVHRYDNLGALYGYTHIGTLWIWAAGCDDRLVQAIREEVGSREHISYGVSLSGEYGIAVRILAHHVRQARSVIETAWDTARRALLGRPAPLIRR